MADEDDDKKVDDDEEEVDDDKPDEPDIDAKIERALERLIPKFLKSSGAEKKTPAAKRPTYRDEEESMFEKVDAKIDELLSREKSSAEKHDEAKSDEKPKELVPAAPRRRRVESAIWG